MDRRRDLDRRSIAKRWRRRQATRRARPSRTLRVRTPAGAGRARSRGAALLERRCARTEQPDRIRPRQPAPFAPRRTVCAHGAGALRALRPGAQGRSRAARYGTGAADRLGLDIALRSVRGRNERRRVPAPVRRQAVCYLISTLTRQWIEAAREFVLRLDADLAAIRRDILVAGAAGRSPRSGRSFRSAQWRRSVHCRLRGWRAGLYKPKDLRLDTLGAP